MIPTDKPLMFSSALAPFFLQHIAEKRSFGCRYVVQEYGLRALDTHLNEHGVTHPDFTKDMVEEWIAKRPNESSATQSARCTDLRQFCIFLERQGYKPFVPSAYIVSRRSRSFAPYIFSEREIRELFSVLDASHSHPRAINRAAVVPLVFRLLYGCGLRMNEALHLRVEDVDLQQGVLTVREAKFLKDRLVPAAPSLACKLQAYARTYLTGQSENDLFFPAPDSGTWSTRVFYDLFRQALHRCGISHRGRSRGPRVHDLRHSFACHRLARWFREGVQVDVALPILAAYLGHESVYQTQRYLHLFPELYPDITAKFGEYCGSVIPKGESIG